MQLLWGVTPVYVMALMSLMTSVALGKMNQAAKDHILRIHNDLRRQEGASNMAKLKWDNKLEEEAAEWAKRCVFEHKGMGENLYYDWQYKLPEEKLIDNAMEAFYNEKELYTYGPHSCGQACHYTQLVWADTSRVGCASHVCHPLIGASDTSKPLWYIVCRYESKGNWIGEYPYEKGKSCDACPANSVCEDGLCVLQEKEPGNEPCKDKDDRCEMWAGWGECDNNPRWMLRNCRPACQNCGSGGCKDEYSECRDWASAGECDRNDVWMLRHCQKSCKVCT